MTSLTKLYRGVQDSYLTREDYNPRTIEAEYLDTVKTIVDASFVTRYNTVYIIFDTKDLQFPEGKNDLDVGFVGLRFLGDPSAVKTIRLEVGGQKFDRIYPSITGTFEGITYLSQVIPKLEHHNLQLLIEFSKEDSPLEIQYDRVLMKERVPIFEIIFHNNQYCGEEQYGKGVGSYTLPYNHPVQDIQFFSTAPLKNTYVVLNEIHKLYVPYKRMQNGMYMYEVHFNGSINFSQVDKATFVFEALEETVIHAFPKTTNLVRYMAGMGGLAWSK